MKLTKTAWAATVALSTALALGACAEPSDSDSDSGNSAEGGGEGGNIVIAETNSFTSLNPNTSEGNVEINSKINSLTTAFFYEVDPSSNIVHNDEVGTFEKVSDDPLTVKYTVNEDMKWSDGNPIDAGDLLMSWAIGSGYFDSAKLDDEGKPVSGYTYFNIAGSTDGLDTTEMPEISDDGRTITLVYGEPYADWEIAYDLPSVPAHVVAKRAGLADEAALVDLIKNTPKGDPENPGEENAELRKVADVWNKDFLTTTMPTGEDEELLLSSGPYMISDIQADQSLTLTKNPEYGGTPGKLDEITVRYIGDATAAIKALRNGEADVISPQASNDTIQQLEEMDGVELLKGDQLAFDHIDLKFNDTFSDPKVREAFLLSIPRQDIVDKINKPLGGADKPLDSQLYVSNKDQYSDVVAMNGSDFFASTDIEKAKELLAGAEPTVKIMYNKDNTNRLDTFNLIRESATKAGFKIEDGGLPASEWGKALDTDGHDAHIFGWISSGVGNGGVPQIYKTGGGGNYTNYSNAELDRLSAELMVTTDKAKQDELRMQIDKILFDDRYGLPLFQSVGVVAYKDYVKGINEYNPTQAGVWWNLDEVTIEN